MWKVKKTERRKKYQTWVISEATDLKVDAVLYSEICALGLDSGTPDCTLLEGRHDSMFLLVGGIIDSMFLLVGGIIDSMFLLVGGIIDSMFLLVGGIIDSIISWDEVLLFDVFDSDEGLDFSIVFLISRFLVTRLDELT